MIEKPDIIESGIKEVQFGKRVKIINPVNLYGCSIGDNCFIGPFVEIQKGAVIGQGSGQELFIPWIQLMVSERIRCLAATDIKGVYSDICEHVQGIHGLACARMCKWQCMLAHAGNAGTCWYLKA